MNSRITFDQGRGTPLGKDILLQKSFHSEDGESAHAFSSHVFSEGAQEHVTRAAGTAVTAPSRIVTRPRGSRGSQGRGQARGAVTEGICSTPLLCRCLCPHQSLWNPHFRCRSPPPGTPCASRSLRSHHFHLHKCPLVANHHSAASAPGCRAAVGPSGHLGGHHTRSRPSVPPGGRLLVHPWDSQLLMAQL